VLRKYRQTVVTPAGQSYFAEKFGVPSAAGKGPEPEAKEKKPPNPNFYNSEELAEQIGMSKHYVRAHRHHIAGARKEGRF
jgi:hypothetical protein